MEKSENYIYGEIFIKTQKNLFMILSCNSVFNTKIKHDFYINVKGYSNQKGKTNTFYNGEGFSLIQGSKVKTLFNKIKEGSFLHKALINRISFNKSLITV